MDEQAKLIETAQRVLTQNYRQQPIVLRRGAGCEVWDVAGTRYLDLTGGIAATPLGHGHPKLAAAIAKQAGELIHVSNLFYVEAQIRLAEKLASLASALGEPRVFFCNSGAEANEAAIKLAKRWQTVVRGRPERVEVLSFDGSFHGRSIATVALTGQEKYRAGFGPLVEWARFVPFPLDENDMRALDAITHQTCAVIIEPIQAEGGIRVPPPDFLKALRERCTQTGTVLIFDEVQTGVGRTGRWFGYEHEDMRPDIISLAKGLAGGVPIGAMVASGELAQGFAPGTHASTFGGNPLACAAALAVIETIEREHLLERVRAAGERLERGLAALVKKYPGRAKEVRGRGLLRGLAVEGDAAALVAKARERGVLLSVAGGTVARFVPAFIVSDAQLDEGLAALDAALGS
ncbi:MAG TPA: aspartate aminotransferase family protein [Polyangia bacterium]|nr:aspartate aminotransferase family protein [Polyangia bacterium]